MKVLKVIFALLVISLPIPSNAGWFSKDEWEKEDCPQKHSFAWCLVDFQGRSKGIKDLSKEEFDKRWKESKVDPNALFDPVGRTLSFGVGVTSLMSLDKLTSAAGFITAFVDSEEEQNSKYTYLIILDNKSGRNREKIAQDINADIMEAIIKVNSELPKEFEMAIKGTLNNFKSPTNIVQFDESHLCFNNKVRCNIDTNINEYSLQKDEDILPEYMGYKSSISLKKGEPYNIRYMLPTGLTVQQLTRAISKYLPDNMYCFIPIGYFGNNPVPFLLHKGEPMFFVK